MNTFLKLSCAFLLLTALPARADNVILMMGDGMGHNHLKCANADKPVYILSLPIQGKIHTKSADHEVTDSAASATAYSCGQKTNNGYLGKLSDGSDCRTIAEEAVDKGVSVGLYSTDDETGASPAAFYAHVPNRWDKKNIKKYKETASEKMDIVIPSHKLSEEVPRRLRYLSGKRRPFFAFFEEAGTDKHSHSNELEKMKQKLYNLDYAVMQATDFIIRNPDTTLIVLADHETGGLTDTCQYTKHSHTGVDIDVYAYGQHADLFAGEQDNTEIYRKIKKILKL